MFFRVFPQCGKMQLLEAEISMDELYMNQEAILLYPFLSVLYISRLYEIPRHTNNLWFNFKVG